MAPKTNHYSDNSDETVVAVYKPRLILLVRHKPHHLSLGDRALMEFGPGLLNFLLMRDCQNHALAESLSSTWVCPVAVGSAACDAVLQPLEGPSPNAFTAIRGGHVWNRECCPTETLLATAQLEAFDRFSITLTYRVVSQEMGDVILEGKGKYVSISSHAIVPYITDFREIRLEKSKILQHRSRFHRAILTALPPRAAELLRRFWWAYQDWRTISQSMTVSNEKKTDSSSTGVAKIASGILALKWSRIPVLLAPGEEASLELCVSNKSLDVAEDLKLDIHIPKIDGLEFLWNDSTTITLQAGAKQHVRGTIRHLETSKAIPGQSYLLGCTLTQAGNQLAAIETHVVVGESFISKERTIFQLCRPRCLEKPSGGIHELKTGDHWLWSLPGDLLRLLYNPIAGGMHPLGRGFHPLGRVPEGAAIWIWMKTLGPDWKPDHLKIHYVAPIDVKHDFRIIALLLELTDFRASTENKIYQVDRLVTKIQLSLVRKI